MEPSCHSHHRCHETEVDGTYHTAYDVDGKASSGLCRVRSVDVVNQRHVVLPVDGMTGTDGLPFHAQQDCNRKCQERPQKISKTMKQKDRTGLKNGVDVCPCRNPQFGDKGTNTHHQFGSRLHMPVIHDFKHLRPA